MIRLVVVDSDCGALAAGCPGAVPETSAHTFDIDNPALEAALQPRIYTTLMLTYEILKPGETK